MPNILSAGVFTFAISPVLQPAFKVAATASVTSLASACKPKLISNINATDKIDANGLALFCPAISCAEPWIGSKNPVPSPIDAEASMPIEPAICEASSVKMSPNKLAVSTTSNFFGFFTNCIAVLSINICSVSTSGYSVAISCTTSLQRRDVSNTFALSTEHNFLERVRAAS
ncbi:hypothetical protein D3C87_1633900 [compost metagenome]